MFAGKESRERRKKKLAEKKKARAERRAISREELDREIMEYGDRIDAELNAKGVPMSERMIRRQKAMLWALKVSQGTEVARGSKLDRRISYGMGLILRGLEPPKDLEERMAKRPHPRRGGTRGNLDGYGGPMDFLSSPGPVGLPIGIWIGLGLVMTAFMGTVGYTSVKMTAARNKMRLMLRAAARSAGYPEDWFDAIGRQESNWNHTAKNESGADAKYGGSYGVVQMTWTNITNLGFTGTRQQFLASPETQMDYMIRLVRQGAPKDSFRSFAAWWNGGPNFRNSSQAMNVYAPQAQDKLYWVQANPPAPETATV